LAERSFADCPQLDVLCVPGGPGQVACMEDQEVLEFLRAQAEGVQWVTSVCTGSLLLGAAGLLRGYRATTHWRCLDLLSGLGADPVAERVVRDRNRVTAAGVSAGIELGISLAALLAGEDTARVIQLQIEYDPQPVFRCGSPRTADPGLVQQAREQTAALHAQRADQVRRLAAPPGK
jgi:cyclohexyl-isocyanide hydratase